MKRRLFNNILRRRSSCGKRCVTTPSSMNRAAENLSIRSLGLNSKGICTNQVSVGRGTNPTIISTEHTKPPSHFFFGAITVALGTAVCFDAALPTSNTACEAPQDTDVSVVVTSAAEAESIAKDEHPLLATRPLWPDGVSEDDVNALVAIILEDSSINIQMIPDSVEAIVYKSAVKLTLNVFYELLAEMNGVPFLSHKIQVARLMEEGEEESDNEEKRGWFSSLFESEPKSSESIKRKEKKYRRIAEAADMKRSAINDEVLDTVATRLLENNAVNFAYIPDVFEIYLYKSCLKVVFRTLQILSHTFHLNLCGHDICLMIEPSALEESALTAASSVSTTLDGKPGSKSKWMDSQIDQKLLKDYAFKAGIDDDTYLCDDRLSWWDRFWLRRRRKMIANLHASLYALMLGLADDLLQHSNIKILSDDIFLDITPAGAPSDNKRKQALPPIEKESNGETKKMGNGGTGKKTSPTQSPPSFFFAAGMWVGAGLMFLVTR
ncbi:MAG: hypothetical protein SGBAC_007270 [Bacillariaceae sp.]